MNHDVIEQLCHSLNQAHDELMLARGIHECDMAYLDWPVDSPQARCIMAAEAIVGRKLAKTDAWTMFPSEHVNRPLRPVVKQYLTPNS